MTVNILMKIDCSAEEAAKKREQIRQELFRRSRNIKTGSIERISAEDLRILFELYDGVYFNYYFRDNLKDKLKFSLSQRMTSNAGKTVLTRSTRDLTCQNPTYEIVMAVKFFFNYEELNRDKKVNGIITKDSLHAFQLVFEHEICHLLEFHLFKESNCRGERFKRLAFDIFKHTDVYHQLPTEKEIAITEYGFKPGDRVEFTYASRVYRGIVNRIGKRATVMVEDPKGEYADKSGTRYSKWYVPLEKLK